MERTLILVKPDGVQRGLTGEIIARFERRGLKMVGMKFMQMSQELAETHYGIHKERPFYQSLVAYITSGPIVAMVWEGNQAAAVIKKIVGSTEPATSDVGTVRGDYTVDSYSHAAVEDRAVRNLIHCTDPEDGPEEAEREIALWMKEDEVMNYVTAQERIMYDVNLDGVTE